MKIFSFPSVATALILSAYLLLGLGNNVYGFQIGDLEYQERIKRQDCVSNNSTNCIRSKKIIKSPQELYEEKILSDPAVSPNTILNLCEKGSEKACSKYNYQVEYFVSERDRPAWYTQKALTILNKVCDNRDKFAYQSQTGSSYTTWCIGRDKIQAYFAPIRRSATGTTISERKSCISSAKRPTNANINREEFDTVSGRVLRRTSEPIYETGMYNKCTYPISVDCVSRRNEKSIIIQPSTYISPSVCVLQFIK
jgi:hypothetical protein